MDHMLRAMTGDQLRQHLADIERKASAFVTAKLHFENQLTELHQHEMAIHGEMARRRMLAAGSETENTNLQAAE